MRYILFFFVIAPIYLSGQTSFFKIISSSLDQDCYSIVELSNGDFITVGRSINDSGESHSYSLLINSTGNIINEQIYSPTNSELRRLCSRNNMADSLLIFESQRNNDFSFLNIYNSNSELLLNPFIQYNFQDEYEYSVKDAINVNDSIFYIFLGRKRPDISRYDFSLLKVNIVDSTFILYSPNEYKMRIPSGMFYDTNNQTIKVSCLGYDLRNHTENKFFTFDSNLNLLETHAFNTNGLGQLRISFNDTSTFLASITIRRSNDSERHNVMKLNSTYQIVDTVELNYGQDTITYPGAGRSMLRTDSCIWIVGMYNIDFYMPFLTQPTWIQLSKLTFDLDIISQHYFGGEGTYTPFDIIETHDHGVAITGFYYDPNNPYGLQMDPFILKTNIDGVVVSSKDHEPPITHEAIVIPNPGTDHLIVKLAVQIKQADFILYDINGKEVLTSVVTGTDSFIDTSQLIAGTYIYHIISDNRLIGSGKWIKAQ